MKKLVLFGMLGLLCFVGCRKTTSSSNGYEYLRDSLGLDSTCVFVPYENDIPGIKALFYIAEGEQDTFHYAVQDNDSIFLWAIVKGKGVHMVRDL